MKVTFEELNKSIQESQNYSFLFAIDINKITKEIFPESNTIIQGIDYQYLDEVCSQIYTKTMEDWNKETNFDHFIKERYPQAEELQKLLILIFTQENSIL